MIWFFRRRRRRYVRDFEGDGAFIGERARTSYFDQGWRDIEAVNDGVRRGPAEDLQRRPAATACDIRDSIRRVQVQCLNQHRVHWREHGFHASELGTPFLAARGAPIGSCGGLVHHIQSYFPAGQ